LAASRDGVSWRGGASGGVDGVLTMSWMVAMRDGGARKVSVGEGIGGNRELGVGR